MELHRPREAAAQLSDDLKDRFPQIPWQLPARLRNRIVHGYRVDRHGDPATTATDQLPAFAVDLRAVLEILNADPEDRQSLKSFDRACAV